MSVRLVPLDAANLGRYQEAIVRIYDRSFHEGVDVAEEFARVRLPRHTTYPDYAGYLAVDERLGCVGFVYGYRSAPGQYWHELIKPQLDRAGQGEWLSDTFEFVELAVDPEARGLKIGSRLHDTLLTERTERLALLATAMADPERPALKLYRSRGWVTLIEQLTGQDFMLMGLDLRAFRSRRA